VRICHGPLIRLRHLLPQKAGEKGTDFTIPLLPRFWVYELEKGTDLTIPLLPRLLGEKVPEADEGVVALRCVALEA
jgi:hypothetical protein